MGHRGQQIKKIIKKGIRKEDVNCSTLIESVLVTIIQMLCTIFMYDTTQERASQRLRKVLRLSIYSWVYHWRIQLSGK